MKMSRSPILLLLTALVIPATSSLAQPGRGRGGRGASAAETATTPAAADAKAGEKKDEPKKDEPKKEEKEPVLSVTDHEITLGGKVIKYKATAGYMAMKDSKTEKTKANLFFVAYTKVGTDDRS